MSPTYDCICSSSIGSNSITASPSHLCHNNMYSPTLKSFDGGGIGSPLVDYQSTTQCLRFKYFVSFLLSTTCLALLSASLVTQKWIVAKPIRILKIKGNQDITSLLTSASQSTPQQLVSDANFLKTSTDQLLLPSSQTADNKFQGEVTFGIFKGVKVLNYGFGDRVSHISATPESNSNGIELVSYKVWLAVLVSVIIATLFTLFGSLLAIVNFFNSAEAPISGPLGLVLANIVACFASLVAALCWLAEYLTSLKKNVLTQEEISNSWNSENRTQLGYSYYFVVIAFVLLAINIIVVALVKFGSSSNKRKLRTSCEGVIMLY